MRAIVSLPALPVPSGATPAARRRALLRGSDDDLGEHLTLLARALRKPGASTYSPLAAAAGLPLGEVIASPFALRMVGMAVERGGSTVHGDLRRVIRWPRSFAAEKGTIDPEHGIWDRGTLKLGKYQQFLQDEPFATFHADHVAKWGPHELMHRATGFFFRPGATRWELYLGSRLNELLPVITWYGPEQAMRLDEGGFERANAKREAPVSAAMWLEDDGRALKARARRGAPLLRDGIERFEQELAAIDEEIATGRRVPVAHPFLDSSSDAIAYVAAHCARLEATGVALAQLVPASAGRCDDIHAYRVHVEACFDALLFAPIEVDLARAAERRRARGLWDLLQRALQIGGSAGKLARSLAKEAGQDIAHTLETSEALDLDGWAERIAGALDGDSPIALANGDRVHGEVALEQLADGIASCAPSTLARFGDHTETVLEQLAASDTFLERAPLGDRLARFLDEHGQERLGALARFEACIASAKRGDDRIERLSEPAEAIAESLDDALVVRSEAFQLATFAEDVAALHAGGRPSKGEHTYLIGFHRGEVAVVMAPGHVIAALEALASGPKPALEVIAILHAGKRKKGWPGSGAAWLRELLSAGVVGWTRAL